MEETQHVQASADFGVLETMKQQVREQRVYGRTYENLHEIHSALRRRRKHLLGTGASLVELVSSEGVLDREKVNILVEYFTERSLRYLDIDEETEDFTRLFYQVSVACIADPLLQNECLDDIIHLGNLLVHDKELFAIVTANLLPAHWNPQILELTEDFPASYYSPGFEDAVLSVIAEFTGALIEAENDIDSEAFSGTEEGEEAANNG